MSIEMILSDILRREGGFIDHPNDPGGATNMGITRKTLAHWRGKAVSKDDVRKLSRNEALSIYEAEYVNGPGLDQLPARLQPVLIDAAVNHGPQIAVQLLQHVLNAVSMDKLSEDGLIGPNTLKSAHNQTERLGHTLIRSVVEERRRFYLRLAARKPDQAVFLDGWLNRIDEFERI